MKRQRRASRPLLGILGAVLLGNGALAAGEGKQVFSEWCAGCHADSPFAPATILLKQTRGPERAVIERRDDLDEAYIRHLVRRGTGGMPSFRRTEVSEAALDAVVDYLTQ